MNKAEAMARKVDEGELLERAFIQSHIDAFKNAQKKAFEARGLDMNLKAAKRKILSQAKKDKERRSKKR